MAIKKTVAEVDTAKATESIAKMAREVRALEKALEDLQSQGEENSEDFKKKTAELEKLGKKLVDAKERVNDFNDSFRLQQGSGLERFRNSLALTGEGVRNLDFSKVKAGVSGATQAFGGLGKAILATGIGALVILVVKLIQNFDEIKKSGGIVGAVFTAIGSAVSFVKDVFIEFSDALGLTTIRTNEAAEAQQNYKNAVRETQAEIDKLALKEKVRNGDLDKFEAQRIAAQIDYNAKFEALEQERLAKLKELGDDASETSLNALREEYKVKRQLLADQTTSIKNDIDDAEKAEEKANKDKLQKEADAKIKSAQETAERLAAERKKIAEQTQKDVEDLQDQAIADDQEREQAVLARAFERAEAEIAVERKKFVGMSAEAVAGRAALDQELLLREAKFQADSLAIGEKYDAAERAREKKQQDLLTSIKNEALDDEERLQEEIENLKLSAQDRELRAVNDAYFEKIEAARRAGLSEEELIEEQERKKAEIRDRYRKEEEKKLEDDDKLRQENITKVTGYISQGLGVINDVLSAVGELQAQQDEQRLQEVTEQNSREVEANKAKYDQLIAQASGNSARQKQLQEEFAKSDASLKKKASAEETKIAKQAFERNKKFQIAQTIISGAQGALAAFAGAQQLGPIAGPIVGGVLAAAVAAITAINVSKIKQTTFDSGGSAGGSGASSVSVSSSSIPEAAPVAFNEAAVDKGPGAEAQAAAQAEAGPQRVYVLESDISNAQARRVSIEQSATIGG